MPVRIFLEGIAAVAFSHASHYLNLQ